jgi:hypothetical protein
LITPQADGTYEIILERSDEPVANPPRAYTLGAVLSAWRTAERELAALAPNSREWTAVQAEIDHFRTEYQRLARRERKRLDGANESGVG